MPSVPPLDRARTPPRRPPPPPRAPRPGGPDLAVADDAERPPADRRRYLQRTPLARLLRQHQRGQALGYRQDLEDHPLADGPAVLAARARDHDVALEHLGGEIGV